MPLKNECVCISAAALFLMHDGPNCQDGNCQDGVSAEGPHSTTNHGCKPICNRLTGSKLVRFTEIHSHKLLHFWSQTGNILVQKSHVPCTWIFQYTLQSKCIRKLNNFYFAMSPTAANLARTTISLLL